MEPKVTKELEDIFKQALVAGYNQDDQAALEAVRLKNNLCACGKELGGGGVSPSRRAFKFLWAFLFFFSSSSQFKWTVGGREVPTVVALRLWRLYSAAVS